MIQVKNVTHYTVALSVSKSYDNTELLSQLKSFSENYKGAIEPTRDEWGKELGIDRQTIRRWEANIISKLFLLGYYDKPGKSRLDDYQRFILSLIWVLKIQRKMTYEEIVSYMVSPKGNPFWLNITRTKFETINANYSRKAG